MAIGDREMGQRKRIDPVTGRFKTAKTGAERAREYRDRKKAAAAAAGLLRARSRKPGAERMRKHRLRKKLGILLEQRQTVESSNDSNEIESLCLSNSSFVDDTPTRCEPEVPIEDIVNNGSILSAEIRRKLKEANVESLKNYLNAVSIIE